MNMTPVKYLLSIAAALTITAPATLAQNAQSGATPQEEIVVFGARLEETIPMDLRRFGNRVEIVTAEDIALGGFNDLSQTLQMTVPGLYVAPKNGAFDYMNCSLQGSRCEDVLWLVDGVRINNRLYNATAPLDTIPAHMIERIEVLYGGQGIFYGTQSVAGVVNVVTKSFSTEPTGSIGIGFDEYNGTHLKGEYRTSAGDHSFVFYASKDESDGFQPFVDADYQPSGSDRERGYDVVTVGAKYAFDFSPESRLTVLYQHTDNELDNTRPYQAAVRNNARVEDLVTAKWDYAVSENVEFFVKAYYHDWDTEWDHITNDLDVNGDLTGTQTTLFQDAFWGFEDYGVTASARIHTDGAFEYAVGYDYQNFWGNDEVWLIRDKTETAQAVYGQIRTAETLFENSNVALGVRYNRTSGNVDATVWNLSGQHDLSDRLYIRGQIGTSFRLPDAEELWLQDCCEVGNPNLEAEESQNFEAAIGGTANLANGLQWQFILFAREVDNLIDIDFNNPAFPDGIFENFAETGEFSGWELAVNVALNSMITASFDYTSNDAEFKGSNEQITDIPERILKLGLNYAATQLPLNVNLSILSVGNIYDFVGGGVGRIEHGGYTVVNLGAAYYLDNDRHHRLGARLENVLDETYAASLGRGRLDIDNSSYAYRNIGVPRTVHVSYSYQF